MKTIQELQIAREEEKRATDFDGFHAHAINKAYIELVEAGRVPHEFPISGDALQRARYYATRQ